MIKCIKTHKVFTLHCQRAVLAPPFFHNMPKTANSHHIAHISCMCSNLKLPLIRRLKACMESKSSTHGG